MNLREFMRFHLLKALLALVALQIGIVAIIQNYNHKPVALSDAVSTIESRKVKIAALINDTDKDDNTELAIAQVNKPINGEVELKSNLIYYTPNDGYVGADSLSYTVTDGKKESELAYIVIEVKPNLPPVTVCDSSLVYEGSITGINVLSNDSDGENDSIFIADLSVPNYGSISQDGNILFYKSTCSVAVDSFYYTCSDGKSSSAKTWVYITVKQKDSNYPWLSTDLGDYKKAGSLSQNAGQFKVQASGSDIWANYDGLNFVYQYIMGDCEISAKLESLEATDGWAKAGVMVREDLSGGSKHAMSLVSFGNGATFHYRTENNQYTSGGDMQANIKAPYWVKLTRKGNLFTFYISATGINWQQLTETEIKISDRAYVGLALSNHDNHALAKADFSHVQLTGTKVK